MDTLALGGRPLSPEVLPLPHLPKMTPAQHCQELEVLKHQG